MELYSFEQPLDGDNIIYGRLYPSSPIYVFVISFLVSKWTRNLDEAPMVQNE